MMNDFPIIFISRLRHNLTLIVAFIIAILLIGGPVRDMWPLSWLGIGFSYMAIFFHELGHSFFGWAFGIPSLPSFDFQHGGGMAWHFDRLIILQFALLGAAAYGVWVIFHHHKNLGIAAGVLWAVYAISALTNFYEIIALFMGNGTEIIIGTYILARVIYDAVPPRPFELEVHALAGWYLVLNPLHLSWGLIFEPDQRDLYWQQKGAEGFGDFSRIADYFGFATEIPVAWFCVALIFLCLGLLTVCAYFNKSQAHI